MVEGMAFGENKLYSSMIFATCSFSENEQVLLLGTFLTKMPKLEKSWPIWQDRH
ncbi:MAG: hypothetical protein ACJATI_004428 [Halioglobus sp.]|jgi:hypothetical protein